MSTMELLIDKSSPFFLSSTVEWSNSQFFAPSMGEFVMTDLRNQEYVIPDLSKVGIYITMVTADVN